MPVDRDDHRRPLAPTERLHHLWRNFQPPHGLRRLDLGSELHGLLLVPLPSCCVAARFGFRGDERVPPTSRGSGQSTIWRVRRRPGSATISISTILPSLHLMTNAARA